MNLEIKKDLTSNWFKTLQESFCDDIIKFEKNKTKFKSTNWRRNTKVDEGGGEYRILQGGKIFEKVGVNFSKVYGKFPKQFQKNILGANKDPRFWASGISVVMHMKNPLIPAMHFNTRFICTTHEWFGGGMDLTPCLDDEKFKVKYHQELKKICDLYDTTWYDKFSKACDEYFYLPHRKETRGIGGLFFEYYSPEDMDFKFVERMGIKFADVMRTTAINYMNNNYTDEHKDIQYKQGRVIYHQ